MTVKIPRAATIFVIISILSLAGERPMDAKENLPKINASIASGYDNNTGLNAQRRGDFFALESASINYKTPIAKNLRLRLGYDVLNDHYFEATDRSFLYQAAGAGVDFYWTPTTLIESDYDFIYLYFPDNDSVTSYTHRARSGIKQKIAKNMILLGGFGTSFKEYDLRKLRQSDRVLSPTDEFTDLRYAVDGGLRVKINNQVMTQVGFIYDRNDSNDSFHDYYDYDNYKWMATTLVHWNKKLRSSFKFAYERREYDSRPIVDDSSTFENDDVYMGSASLYYLLNSHASIGVSYTYRQKLSNEPSQGYSGSITTLGLYYSF